MATLVGSLTEIQARLDSLARQHRVPGASLGIMRGDEFLEFATGVVNKNTNVPTTPETLFQIGSNTKVYTATLMMQLVDQGLVDLDAPVRKYVPELKLADESAAKAITVRMLLTHSSGMQGDYFEEFGRGDDALEKYVESFKTLTQIHKPGEMWTYCNSGFCLAGRVIEKVTGLPYAEALREKLLKPLGLRVTTVLIEEMIAHRYAVGHAVQAPGAEPTVPPRVMMSPAHAPAGSLTSSTAREVLRFVRMHLDGGKGPDGTQVLSKKSVDAMQVPQVKMPGSIAGLGSSVGLAWLLQEWAGERVMGHGGGTIGQLSYLQVLPDQRFGVCLLTNSGTGGFLWRDLGRWLFEELAGVTMPELPKPPEKAPRLDLAKYTGAYERLGVATDVTVDDGQLVITMKQSGPLAGDAPPQSFRLSAIDDEAFSMKGPGGDAIVGFYSPDKKGRPTYLHFGGRASRRTGEAPADKPKPKKKASTKKPARKTSRSRRG